MKKESMRRYSLLGLVLIGASAVTAAVLPKANNDKKVNNGHLIATSDGGDLTCVNVLAANPCTYTQTLVHGIDANNGNGSRTSAVQDGNNTSTITNAGGLPVRTITENNNAPAQDHTSVN